MPEVRLMLTPGQNVPEEGTDIVFAGEPFALQGQPFLLIMQADCDSVFPVHQNYGPPLGTVPNGRYHHNLTGIEFDLPPGWCVQATLHSSGNGEIAVLSDVDFLDLYAAAWMIQGRTPLANIPAQLQAAIPEKLKQRTDFEKYAIRPGSVVSTWIGGHEALRAMADYEENSRPMSETLTWIYTEHTHAFFFARVSAAEMPAFQTHFDQIIYSANIP